MKVVLHRIENDEDGVFGVLSIDGKPTCVTLEREWLGNQRNISCVPAGSYKCVKHHGAKYKDVWAMKDVPNRDAILLHQGNTKKDTRGCILVGQYYAKFANNRGVANSVKTLNMLRQKLPEKFTLEIMDHF